VWGRGRGKKEKGKKKGGGNDIIMNSFSSLLNNIF